MPTQRIIRTATVTACLLGAGVASAQNMAPAVLLDPQATKPDAGYGTTLALTSFGAAIGSVTDNRIWVYPRTRSGFADPIIVTDPFGRDKGLGASVAMQGTTLVAGAPFMDPCSGGNGPISSGVLIAFDFSVQRGAPQQLTHPGQDRLDAFGCSVDIDADTIIAGAKYDNTSGHSAGTAWTFRNINGLWSREAQLVGTDARTGDLAGWSVAIKGNLAVVGAPFANTTLVGAGVARVFERAAAGWTHVATLHSPTPLSNGAFGVAVATDGTRVVVGETRGNRAFVYLRTQNGWQLEQRLTPSRGGGDFGAKIQIDGGRIFIGAPVSNAVESFALDDGLWTRVQRITSSYGTGGTQFGSAIALNGRELLVGIRFAAPDGMAMLMKQAPGSDGAFGGPSSPDAPSAIRR